MHIAIVAPEDLPIPATRGGSVQIYLQHLYSEWRTRKSIQITLISPGIRNETLESTYNMRHNVIQKRGDAYWSHVMSKLSIMQPDIIQIENRPAQAMRIKTMLKHEHVILNLHSLTFLGPRHIQQSKVKSVLCAMDGVVCNSYSLKHTILQRYGIHHSKHFHVIYPGVARRQPTSTLVIFQRPHQPLRLLYVGRVIEQKGVHVAIEATRILQRNTPTTLTVVGRTPPWEPNYRSRLRRLAGSMNVNFIGFVAPNQLSHIYQQHDIFICPSQKHEAFGLVNLEAMQHGLPVVASRIGGIPEAIGSKGGIVVHSYRKAKSFARVIQHLKDKHTYRRYSRNAVLRAKRFTWAQTVKQFGSLYQHR